MKKKKMSKTKLNSLDKNKACPLLKFFVVKNKKLSKILKGFTHLKLNLKITLFKSRNGSACLQEISSHTVQLDERLCMQ